MAQDKILFLGREDSPLIAWLRKRGEQVSQTEDKINLDFLTRENFSFLISYGYRHVLSKEILEKFPNRAINLHLAYLPWNRGSDPNFWSFVENTPKGVTIHFLDEGVDTGDIIIQREICFDSERETLATSYAELRLLIEDLFKKHWQEIKHGTCTRRKQTGPGSSHRSKDMERFSSLLVQGWNTPVSVLEKYNAER